MDLPVSTYALLFPAVSLLFLSYTNRFLHLSSLIRKLHNDWVGNHDNLLLKQIANLRKRLILIRWMQFLGALSLFSSVLGMLLRVFGIEIVSAYLLISALIMMCLSLLLLAKEIWVSGGALKIVLKTLEDDLKKEERMKTK